MFLIVLIAYGIRKNGRGPLIKAIVYGQMEQTYTIADTQINMF